MKERLDHAYVGLIIRLKAYVVQSEKSLCVSVWEGYPRVLKFQPQKKILT